MSAAPPLRDTPRTMSEESATPDLVELVRRQFEAGNRQREAWVYLWVEGLVARFAVYGDIDEARTAAERLAEDGA
jgi:hypothetical protein